MFLRLLRGLTDIIYPRLCLICRKNLKNAPSIEKLVCAGCWANLKQNLPPFCFSCGRHLDAENSLNICATCRAKKLYFDRAFSPCIYAGAIKELIGQLKYKNKDYLGRALSGLMIGFIREYNLPIHKIDFIIAMPLHKRRLREREFNQAKILAGFIASKFNKPLLDGVLKRWRYTETQTSLEGERRFLNVRGSFRLAKNNEVKGKNILLIDDVLTTGATSSEAAYTLKTGGAEKVLVLTLAN